MIDTVLALDLGTSATKLLLVDRAGTVLARQRSPHATLHPKPDAAEQDPDAWWAGVREGVPRLLASVGTVGRVAAIGVTGQMHGLVALDATDRPVRPAITWQDQRSARTLPDLLARLPVAREATIAPGFQAASWHWLSLNEPEVAARAASMLLPKDELARRLTGVRATDPSDAIGTGWFDPATATWDLATLAAAGARPDQLPHVIPAGAVVGPLAAEAARAIGIDSGVPVVLTGGDAAVGAFGAGATAPGTPLVMLSTGCQALDPATERPCRAGWPSASPPGLPRWLRVAATRNGGNVVAWARAAFGAPAAVPDDDLVFLPYLDGERAAKLAHDAAGAFIGLRARHGGADMSRAAIEGVALALADSYELAGGEIGTDAPILAGGGGVRDDVWLDATARAFGRPLHALNEPDLSAWGAARSAATALGWIDPVADPGTWTPGARRLEPGISPEAAIDRLRRFRRRARSLYGVTDDDRV